ncbi:MAG: VOC family protein [Gemmatimonadales bacterium]
MGLVMPGVPKGSGKHPIALVVVSANDLAASGAFYSRLFGWQLQPMSAELTAVMPPGGPMAALRSKIPAGFPGMVPYIGVPDVAATLAQLVTAGATVERASWKVPMVGTLARFKDASGTVYGLTDAVSPDGAPHIPMPLGPNPKPPAGAICSLEMFAADGANAAQFFGEWFGWGSVSTMSQYMAFDPGAGVGGVFQSHTPSLPALAYIYATDVGAKLTEIEAAGGKRMGEPMRLPEVACFGYFADPSGTSMGLIGP